MIKLPKFIDGETAINCYMKDHKDKLFPATQFNSRLDAEMEIWDYAPNCDTISGRIKLKNTEAHKGTIIFITVDVNKGCLTIDAYNKAVGLLTQEYINFINDLLI